MYRKFYGLTRNPFELSPDPSFFYSTDRHNEALAVLAHGVLGRKGFVVVTGEVGTGKTLLVRCLLDALTSKQVAFAYVYNPMLSVPDFLAHVLSDLGLPSLPRTKGESLFHLNNYLLLRSRRGATT
ncbi:MAG: AAA family ATPase, partial [Candidatus Acidiferrales bacterium]